MRKRTLLRLLLILLFIAVVGILTLVWRHNMPTYNDTLIGGDAATLIAGSQNLLLAGNNSTLTAEDDSVLWGGIASTLTGGKRCILIGGIASTIYGGEGSSAQGDASSSILLMFNGAFVTGVVGIDLIANTLYMLDGIGNFILSTAIVPAQPVPLTLPTPPATPIMEVKTFGDGVTYTSGLSATLTGGSNCTFTGGDGSTLTAVDNSNLTAGFASTLAAQDNSTLLCGDSSSTVTGRNHCWLQAGYGATIRGGVSGMFLPEYIKRRSRSAH
jgi:hypothetical protein